MPKTPDAGVPDDNSKMDGAGDAADADHRSLRDEFLELCHSKSEVSQGVDGRRH